jgi:superfamily II DNA or RNA helicase
MQTDLFDAGDLPSRVLSDVLTARDIASNVTSVALARGRNYQKQGRVSDVSISPDLKTVTASVKGSEIEPYQQSIVISMLGGSRVHIDGTCTCPLRHNCKHVAAALFEALSRKPANGSRPAVVTGPVPALLAPLPPPMLPLPYEVKSWLDEFANSETGEEFPSDITQRLLYLVISRNMPNSAPHLAVDIISARVLKNGSFSNSITRPALYNYYSGNFPRYFRSSDIEICQALISARGGYNHSSYSVKSLSLLKSIIDTGRAYWQTQNGKPLSMGETRRGQIEWVMPDAKGMRPVLKVEGAIALNAEPPVYVDAEQSLIGEVDLPLPRQLSHRLLNAPAIAPAHVQQVSQTLGRHLPAGTNLVPKPPEPAVIVEEEPTPLLRLMLAKSNTGAFYRSSAIDVPIARLAFRYGPIDVPPGELSPVVETVIANRIHQAKRRPSREKEAIKKLMSHGLRLTREIYFLGGAEHAQDFAFSDPEDWLDFLAQSAPDLQEQGFGIRIDDDFPYRLAKPSGDLDTEIFEGTGVDWFELGMGIQVDGEKLDLAPLLASLVLTEGLSPAAVSVLAEDDDDIYIPLADGRHLALAAKRYLPVIVALHEFALGGAVVGKNGRLRVSRAETVLLSGLEGHEGIVFKGGENLRKLARVWNKGGSGIAPVTLPESFKATLRPYQSQGVAWLNLLRDVGLGGILADDMGLGKTVQILALLSVEKAEGRLTTPALIIAPTSLMTNWQNEARRFAPELNLLLLHGAARKGRFEEIANHDIVLTTYPLIARDQTVLLEQHWHIAILDEAQTIKNPNAATTKLIRDLKSTHRFCLTGTPMENHLGELWSLMSFVNPGYLGDKTGFARRWRNPIEKRGDSERSNILARRVKPFMLRRTKQEVASELPPKTEITESIVLDSQQRDVYDSIRLSMHKKVRDAIAAKGFAKSHIIILEALLKLRQVCCDPRLLKLGAASAAAKNPAPSAKLERLMEMLDSLLPEGRKIIIFSQFTSMLQLIMLRLEAAGISFSLLTGETTDRKSAIENFQTGQVNVFLVSLKAGGVGLNLTAADTVILYDPWWNPAVEEQAIDRAYRIGQDKPVFVYRLVVSQTIEEKMDELKARKRAIAESIFNQAANPAAALTEDDLDSLFDEY